MTNIINDGKVGYNTVDYATVFLYSDWLYYLWHGINSIGIVHQDIWNSLNAHCKRLQESIQLGHAAEQVCQIHLVLTHYYHKNSQPVPDLDSLSAGLTCIAFCICDKKKHKNMKFLIYHTIQNRSLSPKSKGCFVNFLSARLFHAAHFTG